MEGQFFKKVLTSTIEISVLSGLHVFHARVYGSDCDFRTYEFQWNC